MREKIFERLVRLTRGREGRDPSRLLLEPIIDRHTEREREKEREAVEDDDESTMIMEN
jgi:hypothetical protein